MAQVYGHVTADVLRRALGAGATADLAAATTLTLRIDTREEPAAIGELLPALRTLILDRSYLTSLRDLGTALRQLTTLSATRCGLRDLDGVSALAALRHLNVAHNAIADVSGLSMMETLTEVNLAHNALSDVRCLLELATCPALKRVDLSGNGVCAEARGDGGGDDGAAAFWADTLPGVRVMARLAEECDDDGGDDDVAALVEVPHAPAGVNVMATPALPHTPLTGKRPGTAGRRPVPHGFALSLDGVSAASGGPRPDSAGAATLTGTVSTAASSSGGSPADHERSDSRPRSGSTVLSASVFSVGGHGVAVGAGSGRLIGGSARDADVVARPSSADERKVGDAGFYDGEDHGMLRPAISLAVAADADAAADAEAGIMRYDCDAGADSDEGEASGEVAADTAGALHAAWGRPARHGGGVTASTRRRPFSAVVGPTASTLTTSPAAVTAAAAGESAALWGALPSGYRVARHSVARPPPATAATAPIPTIPSATAVAAASAAATTLASSSSALTHGEGAIAFAGSPVLAARRRRTTAAAASALASPASFDVTGGGGSVAGHGFALGSAAGPVTAASLVSALDREDSIIAVLDAALALSPPRPSSAGAGATSSPLLARRPHSAHPAGTGLPLGAGMAALAASVGVRKPPIAPPATPSKAAATAMGTSILPPRASGASSRGSFASRHDSVASASDAALARLGGGVASADAEAGIYRDTGSDDEGAGVSLAVDVADAAASPLRRDGVGNASFLAPSPLAPRLPAGETPAVTAAAGGGSGFSTPVKRPPTGGSAASGGSRRSGGRSEGRDMRTALTVPREELVAMLRARPKTVPELHSREAYQRFFAGFPLDTLRTLLTEAYADLPDVEREAKVDARMALVDRR